MLPCTFSKISRNSFLWNTCRRLLPTLVANKLLHLHFSKTVLYLENLEQLFASLSPDCYICRYLFTKLCLIFQTNKETLILRDVSPSKYHENFTSEDLENGQHKFCPSDRNKKILIKSGEAFKSKYTSQRAWKIIRIKTIETEFQIKFSFQKLSMNFSLKRWLQKRWKNEIWNK